MTYARELQEVTRANGSHKGLRGQSSRVRSGRVESRRDWSDGRDGLPVGPDGLTRI